jgi:hypothetical protein
LLAEAAFARQSFGRPACPGFRGAASGRRSADEDELAGHGVPKFSTRPKYLHYYVYIEIIM